MCICFNELSDEGLDLVERLLKGIIEHGQDRPIDVTPKQLDPPKGSK
jgi:hypothetical protein